VLVVAGPQKFGEPKSRRALTNIEICLDVSGSMTAAYGDGSRYDAAMKSVQEFLDYRKGDAFGLTFFGNSVLHWCPLTSDVSAIRCSPPFMRPESLPMWFNGTEIGRALRACKQVLAGRQEGDRMILLVSDGMSSDLFGTDVALAKDLKDNNIIVYAVIIGMESIQDEVQSIATGTGGQAFLAGDPDALKAVFQRIDKMQQTRLEKTIAEASDWFVPFCVAGLSVLGLGTLALFGVRYTPW
jgi:Ca-activated chloride channel family protein